MIGAYAGAALIVIGFAVIFVLLDLTPRARRVGGLANAALATLRDPRLDDDAKETALQAAAKQLFGLFFLLTAGLGAALAVPVGAAWLLGRAGLWSFDAVIAASLSWPVIIAGLGVFVASLFVAGRRGVRE